MDTQISLQHKILILDFGAQYTQLIGRCIREIGVYCEIIPFDVDQQWILDFNPDGIILSGSHASTYEDYDTKAPQCVFESGVPVLGICYGMQTMVFQLGGEIENANHQEYGSAIVNTICSSELSGNSGQALSVWMSHGDQVSELPGGFVTVGQTDSCPHAIIADEKRKFYGVQFHPEVTHTVEGKQLLSRFVLDICNCSADWIPSNIIENQISSIRTKVGSDNVILGLSGGVDSSVVAALLNRAIGSQLTCIFVDTGLLRLNEGDQVMDTFSEHMGVKIIRVNAENEFLSRLEGVVDPELKRKVIGKLFVEIFERESKR